MSIEDAKKILSGDVAAISPEILQQAVKIILSELSKAEEKISSLEKKFVADLPGETWRDVVGYEGFYKVSNQGRVKSFYHKEVVIRKLSLSKEGYVRVHLSKNSERKKIVVHRLVAEAFIENPENKRYVNHLDGDKKNNCVENLEWVTNSENQRHAYNIGLQVIRQGENGNGAKLTNEQAKFIRENYKPRDKEFGLQAMIEKFGVGKSTIFRILANETYKTDK